MLCGEGRPRLAASPPQPGLGEMDGQSHNPARREGETLQTPGPAWRIKQLQLHAVFPADSCTVRASCPVDPCPVWETGAGGGGEESLGSH